MNLRHAGALALISWYLILPPWVWTPDQMAKPLGERIASPDLTASYSEWTIEHIFDSAKECEATKQEWHEYRGGENALCIATDDPRLKP
jgi:hypothetical protein